MTHPFEDLCSVIAHGTDEEGNRAVMALFPDYPNVLQDEQTASRLSEASGFYWSRNPDGVVTVYRRWMTGLREVYHPIAETLTTDDDGVAKCLVLSILKGLIALEKQETV